MDPKRQSINLYPKQSLLNQAYSDVISFLNWTKMAIIYEHDYGKIDLLYFQLLLILIIIRCVIRIIIYTKFKLRPWTVWNKPNKIDSLFNHTYYSDVMSFLDRTKVALIYVVIYDHNHMLVIIFLIINLNIQVLFNTYHHHWCDVETIYKNWGFLPEHLKINPTIT